METEEDWQKLARETVESMRAYLVKNDMGHLIPSEEEFKRRAKKKLAQIENKIKAWQRLREDY